MFTNLLIHILSQEAKSLVPLFFISIKNGKSKL